MKYYNRYIDPRLIQFLDENVIPINIPIAVTSIDGLLPGEQVCTNQFPILFSIILHLQKKVYGIFDDIRYLHSQLPSTLVTEGKLVITNYKFVVVRYLHKQIYSNNF